MNDNENDMIMEMYEPIPVMGSAASLVQMDHRIPPLQVAATSPTSSSLAYNKQQLLHYFLQRITQNSAGTGNRHHLPVFTGGGNFSIHTLNTFVNQTMELFNRSDIDEINSDATNGGGPTSIVHPHNDVSGANDIQQSLWIKILFYVFYVVICLLGIMGNMIVCYVVARKSAMHTVTNVFIANLALSDILLCLFAVPFTPLYLITFKSWIFGSALCRLVPFAQGISVYISTLTLMSIAIDRYFVILLPFKPRMQMRTCILIILTIWIMAIILTFPYAHFIQFEEGSTGGNDAIYYCTESWPHELKKLFAIITPVIQFVIPFLIITFCYVKICAKLWDRARTIPGNVSVRREEQERERTRKTNRMLISMVIIFVVSWLPLNVFNLLIDFYEGAAQWPYQDVLFLISHAIAMSSTCYNPFLYAWLNDNFRKEFKAVLPCCFALCRTGTMPTLVELKKSQQNQSINNNNNNNVTNSNIDHQQIINNSSIINRPSISGDGGGESKKFIQICSKKDGVTCEISMDNNNKFSSKMAANNISEMEEARQSLISKNKCMIRYDGGGRQYESISVGTHNSSSSIRTFSSHTNDSSNQCEP